LRNWSNARAMRHCGSKERRIDDAYARANAAMAERRIKVYCDESSCVWVGWIAMGAFLSGDARRQFET
jgi:hypothetical protein